jgi:hypothetical protein
MRLAGPNSALFAAIACLRRLALVLSQLTWSRLCLLHACGCGLHGYNCEAELSFLRTHCLSNGVATYLRHVACMMSFYWDAQGLQTLPPPRAAMSHLQVTLYAVTLYKYHIQHNRRILHPIGVGHSLRGDHCAASGEQPRAGYASSDDRYERVL